jgi:hypothetical protein
MSGRISWPTGEQRDKQISGACRETMPPASCSTWLGARAQPIELIALLPVHRVGAVRTAIVDSPAQRSAQLLRRTSLLRLDISGEWCRRVFSIAYRWGSMFERHVDEDWSLLTSVR